MTLTPDEVESIASQSGAREWLISYVDNLLKENAKKGIIGCSMDFYRVHLPDEHRPTVNGKVSSFVPDETIAWMCDKYEEAGWEVTNIHDRAGFNESYTSTHKVTLHIPKGSGKKSWRRR